MATEKKKYNALDGLKTLACICIILMHMSANNNYQISGFVYEELVPRFTNFVYLFMVLSAFGMCCGYYRKVLTNTLNLTEFYKKRYLKILPFFSCLIALDLVMSISKESVYEAIADLSLSFGLFPNDIKVIGVGWFLGLVFAFYMIFPFYCVLIETKKRAWFVFIISLILNYICGSYFEIDRKNIVYSFCFFMAGGLLFLYKDYLSEIKWYLSLLGVIASIAAYVIFNGNTYTRMFVAVALVIFALGKGGVVLDNKVTHFISGISLEMYLSHMVIFRILEKLHMNSRFGNGVLQYIIISVLVISIDIVFAYVAQKVINAVLSWITAHTSGNTKKGIA